MFKVYVHSKSINDFTEDIYEKIDELLINKPEVSIITNYNASDFILMRKYKLFDFDNIFTEHNFIFNNLDAVIFINNCTTYEKQDLLKLAREKNLKIRIIQ